MKKFLTEEQKNNYKHYGAIVIKNVFESWIESLQEGFDKVLANPGPHARENVKNNEDGLVILAEKLKKQSSAHNIFLKIGEEGLLIHSGNIKSNEFLTDRIYALNSAPRDVAGAGDSLLISSALTLASGGNIWEAAIIGSLAAAIQVGRVGNTQLQANGLLQELH